MRTFIKFVLVLLVLLCVCNDYKLITNDEYGFQTIFNDNTFNSKEITELEAVKIIATTKKIYTYKAFGRRVYVFERNGDGNVMVSEESDNSTDPTKSALWLVKLYSGISGVEMQNKGVFPWYLYLIGLVVIMCFPKFGKHKELQEEIIDDSKRITFNDIIGVISKIVMVGVFLFVIGASIALIVTLT